MALISAVIEEAIAQRTWWYRNCRRQRRRGAKICLLCPIRYFIQQYEIQLGSAILEYKDSE